MPTYTAEEIRVMDDMQLTHLAVDLGLLSVALDGQPTLEIDVQDEDGTVIYWEVGVGLCEWEPCTNLAQADALLRSMRPLGWITKNTYDPCAQGGTVAIMRPDTEPGTADLKTMYGCDYTTAEEEARAIVLVSVLAHTREQQEG